MLQKTLKLWVACRFIESKWRCWTPWGGSGSTDNPVLGNNPRDPFYDWESPPPYLDYQIASIIIHRILSPLRRDVLRDLQSTLNVHDPKDWFTTFLTCFILLQNYELQMQFQRQFAARRNAEASNNTPFFFSISSSTNEPCRFNISTCRLCVLQTPEPRRYWPISTTATRDRSSSPKASTGTRNVSDGWRDWTLSKQILWGSVATMWSRKVSDAVGGPQSHILLTRPQARCCR